MTENKPWDVKTLCLSLGGPDDALGYLRFEIFDDCSFSIDEGKEGREPSGHGSRRHTLNGSPRRGRLRCRPWRGDMESR